MAKQQGVVTKIYELKTLGFEKVDDQFSKLSSSLAKLKAQIIDLQGRKIGLDGKDLEKVNKQIIDNSKQQDVLKTKLADVTNEGNKSASMYFRLNKAYIDSKKYAQEMAAAHGVESKHALEAAAAAGVYKEQLIQINSLIKTGGKPAVNVLPTNVPFTTNLAELEKEQELMKQTGATVDELNLKEAEATNLAAASAQANATSTLAAQENAAAVAGLSTKYELYTGSLQDNIRVQLENNSALAVNRTQQKELETAIAASGGATEIQTAKLIALRQEEVLLIETNKALTVTVRNQAKELISANGSLDEGQAQLNQLQQSYEALSDTEKASPFGKEMKAEIDGLEPKVKSLEAELGKFSRNVGNYPQQFTGAFKVIENELESVKAKIVSGNFGGKELDQLVARERVLTAVTGNLGKEYATTAQQANAFKEAGRQISTVYGSGSETFKKFSSQVAVGNQQLREADRQLNQTATTAKKTTNVFNTFYGGLRRLANLIPGIGISGLLLLIPNALFGAFRSLANALRPAKKELDDFVLKQHALSEISTEAAKNLGSEYGKIELIRGKLNDLNIPQAERIRLAKLYNETADASNKLDTSQINNLSLINSSISTQIELIKQRALARAAESIISQKAEALLSAEEKAREKNLSEVNQISDETQFFSTSRKMGDKIITVNSGKAAQDMVREWDRRTLLAERISKDPGVVKAKEEFNAALNAGLSLTTVDSIFEFKNPEKAKTQTSKDIFADIEATRSKLLALENNRVNEIQRIRNLSFQEEKTHLKNIEQINVEALNKKLDLWRDESKLTRIQKAERAKFLEELSSTQLETSQKLNAIDKKEFEEKAKNLNQELETELSAIKERNKLVQDNLVASDLEKSQAQLQADQDSLAAKQKYLDKLLKLDAQYNEEAVHNAKIAVSEVEAALQKDRDNISLGTLKAVEDAGNKEITAQQIKYSKIRNSILANEKLTAQKKKELLDELDRSEKRTVLSKEIERLKAELYVMQYLLALGLTTEADFLKKQRELFDKQGNLLDLILGDDEDAKKKANEKFTDLKSFLQDGLRKILKIDKGSEKDSIAGRIIAESFALAEQAMNGYFDAEEDRIKKNLDLQLERIDMEKQQVISRAQSQAEIDSLEKQYEAKKKKAQRDAGELLKKNRRTEAKLALAAELANIAVQASAFPFPASLIIGGILSGLALGRYALRAAEINRQQFEKGGVPTKTGGRISGPSHSGGGVPFTHEAEGGELAIINKNSASRRGVRTMTGTPMQIASLVNQLGGGVAFAPGAVLSKFGRGGYLGDSLQPPVFFPSNYGSGSGGSASSSVILEAIKEQALALQAIGGQRIEVVQVTQTVTNAQKKSVQQSAIGTM